MTAPRPLDPAAEAIGKMIAASGEQMIPTLQIIAAAILRDAIAAHIPSFSKSYEIRVTLIPRTAT